MKSKGADTLRSEVVDEVVIEGPGIGGFEVIVPIEIVAGALLSVPLQGRFVFRLQIILAIRKVSTKVDTWRLSCTEGESKDQPLAGILCSILSGAQQRRRAIPRLMIEINRRLPLRAPATSGFAMTVFRSPVFGLPS